MPNTAPVVDEPSVLRSLVGLARTQARVPVGFLASITRGLRGEEMTEMAALRDAGALGFTDDGKPVTSAGMLRKALQYQRLCGGVVALHEEDPALSGEGVMHEGRSPRDSAWPGSLRSRSRRWWRATRWHCYEGARALPASLLHRSVTALKASGSRRPGQRRGLPPPPDADRRCRAHAREPLQDEPTAARRA